MNEQRMSDMDRREFVSIIATAATGVLAAALLPENLPIEDVEVAETDDDPVWIGGY